MYDEWSLRELLEKYGFKEIEKMPYGQGHIQDITRVEEESRHERALCLEGVKK